VKTSKKPLTHDDYLGNVPADQRAALQKLRKAIRAAAPRAEECISYGLPGFRLDGRVLCHYGSARKHCSFYPGATIGLFAKELAGYDTSKGTIRFPADEPLPAALVKKIVKARTAARAR